MKYIKLYENFDAFNEDEIENDIPTKRKSSNNINAQRMLVINKLLDKGKFTELRKSLMTKLTGDYTIGMLTDKEQELYYYLLRGKKEDKITRNKLINSG